MDDTKERLAKCFVLLFPDLNTSEILTANQRDIAGIGIRLRLLHSLTLLRKSLVFK